MALENGQTHNIGRQFVPPATIWHVCSFLSHWSGGYGDLLNICTTPRTKPKLETAGDNVILIGFHAQSRTVTLSRMSDSPDSTKPKEQKVDLRLPYGLRAALTTYAKKHGRSANQQIVKFIEDGMRGIDATTMAYALLEIRQELAQLKEIAQDKRQ